MMKRKVLTLFTICLLALSACSKSPEDIRGTIVTQEATSASSENQSADAPSASEDTSEKTSDKETSSGASEETAASSEEEISLGHSLNNIYESTFLGIGCKLNEEWTFLSDEEIRKANQFMGEFMGEEMKRALKNATTFTDMMATHSNGMDTVNISFEKLPLAYSTMTEMQYLELSEKNMEVPLKNMGMEDVSLSIGKCNFLGKEYSCLIVSATYSGSYCYETIVPIKRSGYVANVVACTWNENKTLELLESFYVLE